MQSRDHGGTRPVWEQKISDVGVEVASESRCYGSDRQLGVSPERTLRTTENRPQLLVCRHRMMRVDQSVVYEGLYELEYLRLHSF